MLEDEGGIENEDCLEDDDGEEGCAPQDEETAAENQMAPAEGGAEEFEGEYGNFTKGADHA